MRYKIHRTETEIDATLNEAHEHINKGPSKFPGMRYEDGLVAMFEWLTEEESEGGPMEN